MKEIKDAKKAKAKCVPRHKNRGRAEAERGNGNTWWYDLVCLIATVLQMSRAHQLSTGIKWNKMNWRAHGCNARNKFTAQARRLKWWNVQQKREWKIDTTRCSKRIKLKMRCCANIRKTMLIIGGNDELLALIASKQQWNCNKSENLLLGWVCGMWVQCQCEQRQKQMLRCEMKYLWCRMKQWHRGFEKRSFRAHPYPHPLQSDSYAMFSSSISPSPYVHTSIQLMSTYDRDNDKFYRVHMHEPIRNPFVEQMSSCKSLRTVVLSYWACRFRVDAPYLFAVCMAYQPLLLIHIASPNAFSCLAEVKRHSSVDFAVDLARKNAHWDIEQDESE